MTVIFNRYFIRYFIIYILDHLYKLKIDTMNSTTTRNGGNNNGLGISNARITASKSVPVVAGNTDGCGNCDPNIAVCCCASNTAIAVIFPPYAIVLGAIIVVGFVAYHVNNARKEHKYQKAQQNENSI